MCGIAAIVEAPPTFPSKLRLEDVADFLSHRGPDNSRTRVLDTKYLGIALVHTRLAIIDQSVKANQPFSSQDERWFLIFNGEIYNYIELRSELNSLGVRFRTSSDTEVLMAAFQKWGPSCLSRLRGMFSFVLVDRSEEILYAARDPFGVKPLYITKTPNGIGFASEINALQRLTSQENQINEQTVLEYISIGTYDQSQRTFFRGIESLPPGSLATVDFSGLEATYKISHWFVRPSTQEKHRTLAVSAEELRQGLFLSVERQLRSDVDVAVSLSGGLDSSAICAAIRQRSPDLEINTFSFTLPGLIQDESEWSMRVASDLKTNHQQVDISPSEFPYFFDQTLNAQGEPFGSSSAIAQFAVYDSIRQAGFKVVLEGQGADEALAGYQGFPEDRLFSYVQSRQLIEGLRFMLGWQRNPSHSLVGLLQRLAAKLTISGGDPNLARLAQSLLSSSRVVQWPAIWGLLDRSDVETARERPNPVKSRALVARLSDATFGGPLLPLLRHGDRSSMANSVENRVPFLDVDLITTAFSLPEEHLLSPLGVTKYVLRQAIRGYLPHEVVWRQDKVGFEGDDLSWLRLLESNPDKFLEPLELFEWLKRDKIRGLLREVWSGNIKYSRLVWRLACLSRWTRNVA